MYRLKAALITLIVLLPTIASAQHYVPGDCRELAIREGFPTDVLNESQAEAAKKRMRWLKVKWPSDPLLAQCRNALKAGAEVNK